MPNLQISLQEANWIAGIVYYLVGSVGIALAAYSYRRNSRLEEARWLLRLFEKFYEEPRYKTIRDALDCDIESGAHSVSDLVSRESADFTDYLNFFEFVAVLVQSRQISRRQIERLFQYYLECIKMHKAVREYIADKGKGYEQLRALLSLER
jgi:hypothetical protein